MDLAPVRIPGLGNVDPRVIDGVARRPHDALELSALPVLEEHRAPVGSRKTPLQ
jgi:hypothetical protein